MKLNISRQCGHCEDIRLKRLPVETGGNYTLSLVNKKLSRLAMRPCRACQKGAPQ